jgi:hypothetical protein
MNWRPNQSIRPKGDGQTHTLKRYPTSMGSRQNGLSNTGNYFVIIAGQSRQ